MISSVQFIITIVPMFQSFFSFRSWWKNIKTFLFSLFYVFTGSHKISGSHHWLSDSKLPQISAAFLSILTDSSNNILVQISQPTNLDNWVWLVPYFLWQLIGVASLALLLILVFRLSFSDFQLLQLRCMEF